MRTRLANCQKNVCKNEKQAARGNLHQQSIDKQNQKEDKTAETNVSTYHKITIKEIVSKTRAPTTSIYNNKPIDRYGKIRTNFIKLYSKLQYSFNLSMDALFLSIELFDRVLDIYQSMSEDIENIALACFMIAIKYEQVYPPGLKQIQNKMKNWLSFKSFVETEFMVLGKLNYQISLQSIHYINDCLEEIIRFSIPRNCSYKLINSEMLLLELLFLPLSHTLNGNNSARVQNCLKKLIIERSRLDEAYLWLMTKYSDPKFHCMAKKPCYLGQSLEE